MKTYTGTLEFETWHRPWWLSAGPDTTDLADLFWMFAVQNRGKRAVQKDTRDGYELVLDETSDFEIKFETLGAGIILSKGDRGFGFSNVLAYLESSMQRLNARRAVVEVDDRRFAIEADPSEEVFGVRYFGDGNSSRVPDGAETSVCKIGTAEACLFLTAGPDGFQCQKFNSVIARMLLHRRAEGQIRATRIGNCTNIGREESHDAAPEVR